jgi:hypothetical protein
MVAQSVADAEARNKLLADALCYQDKALRAMAKTQAAKARGLIAQQKALPDDDPILTKQLAELRKHHARLVRRIMLG